MPIVGAAYLRCSDPKQDKSIDQQRVEIERRAAADGVVIPPENWFIDEGISGRSTKRRTSYQGLIKRAEAQRDALRGKGKARLMTQPPIERLYVWAFSRIARNMFDCLKAIATLDDADIDIVSLTEHDTGDRSMRKLIRPILAWLAERYSEELSRNVSRGMASQASKGFWSYGTTSYGYEAVEVDGGRKLAVTDATRDDFETVKRIFRMADEGTDGARRIAERLTREGVQPPSEANHPREVAPGAWLSRHVHNILKNPVYCGHVVNKGEIVHRHAHEAAVDDVTFARIQAKRRLRASSPEGGTPQPVSPLHVGPQGVLTPFLRCGHCGGRVIVVASSRKDARTWLYFCGTRRDNKAACPGVSVRVDTLDPKVLDAIEQQVLEPENVKELIGDTLEALNAADGDHAAAERERLTALIGELDRKIRLAATHAINGMIDEDDAKAITAPLVAQRERARLELAALPARAEVPTADRVDAAKFREAILAAWRERPLEERREALAKVLDTITLEPGGVTVRYDAAEYCGAQRIGSVHQRLNVLKFKPWRSAYAALERPERLQECRVARTSTRSARSPHRRRFNTPSGARPEQVLGPKPPRTRPHDDDAQAARCHARRPAPLSRTGRPRARAGRRLMQPVDLVLSSGFLAFARQAGFLAAVEDTGLPVDGLCGTSSGALAGALWATGLPAAQVLAELTRHAPLASLRPAATPWRGALSMQPVLAQLRALLPPTFAELARPFGVGVVTAAGHQVLTSGPLPEAVAASCAIPWLFVPVDIDGVPTWDGGVADRTGLAAWRAHRGERPTLLHLVARTQGAIGGAPPPDVRVVHSPASGARLWSLGDVAGQFAETRAACRVALASC